METNELIRHVRARVEQCRRLAKYINDPRTTEALLKMAEEGEADIARWIPTENGASAAELKGGPPNEELKTGRRLHSRRRVTGDEGGKRTSP